MGGVDGDCWYCRHAMENLCDRPIFTGYTVDGGYAEYALGARLHFLAAGLTTFTSPRCSAPASSAFAACGSRESSPAKSRPFGFGTSAITIAVLQSWKCEVYVVTRGVFRRKAAESRGATWVGKENEKPPVELDRAITFAPSGEVVVTPSAFAKEA